MAVTIEVKEVSRALMPLRYVANEFLKQTLEQIQRNLEVQHVWPTEIYPNFHSINEIRRRQAERAAARGKKGPWYSTGEGAKSFEGTLVEANEETGMVTMSFRFNDYMQYVDIGVGAGRKAEDVERKRNVNFKNRYTKWYPGSMKSHRPAIMPELRHLTTRLGDAAADLYGSKFEFNMYETFEGLTILV